MAYDFPASPTDGTTYTPSGGPTYVASGGLWLLSSSSGAVVMISDAAPATPVHGQLWWDSSTGNLYVYYMDGTSNQWVQVNTAG